MEGSFLQARHLEEGRQTKRLGLNHGRYCGETVDIHAILDRIRKAARRTGWGEDSFLETASYALRAYHRAVPNPRKRLYLSSGIHGDEPAGPLAILELLSHASWPADVEVWICPCLNPAGFQLNTRENAHGIDLNRDYRHLLAEEVRAHVAWLNAVPEFDLALVLHEDWEADGFYLYELNPLNRPTLAERIIEQVRPVCPIETAGVVDHHWPSQGGIVRPNLKPEDRPQWPESIYLIRHKARQSYTLEAPSDFPLSTRVTALYTAVVAALEAL
jgi:murein peptide amidase A